MMLQQLVRHLSMLLSLYVHIMHLLRLLHQTSESTSRVSRDIRLLRRKRGADYLDDTINDGDLTLKEQLRMNRNTYDILCELLREYGLSDSRDVNVEEQVCFFLHILAGHQKNRSIKHAYRRSSETVSKYFNNVLNCLLRLHDVLLKKPEPINETCNDPRWKCFQNCLGALDGTHIRVRVPPHEHVKYRNRKGEISTNVLGVCTPNMMFTYVLPGWEGSAADGRVLRDAITRKNGLRVPAGYYYLCDAGYTNGDGFLAPHRMHRYHLATWRNGRQPTCPEEYFNMKHSSARNVIERAFGVLKLRWAILRSPSFYPYKIQCRIITACVLLHNLIRKEMGSDPYDAIYDDNQANQSAFNLDSNVIDTCEPSSQWTEKRRQMGVTMYNEWRAKRGLAPWRG